MNPDEMFHFWIWREYARAQIHLPPRPCSQQRCWARAFSLLNLCLPREGEALWLLCLALDLQCSCQELLWHAAFSSSSKAVATMSTGR